MSKEGRAATAEYGLRQRLNMACDNADKNLKESAERQRGQGSRVGQRRKSERAARASKCFKDSTTSSETRKNTLKTLF